ncbi:MAG TPA: DUF6600 domain-containing protein, partial [Thermoanaerobaculia bacterium]
NTAASLAQDDDDIHQTVARIAYLSGSASFNRGDDLDNWQEATVNFPMTLGDRLYTARDGRIELQTSGVRIYLAPETDLSFLDFRDEIRQLSITIGTASFRVNQLAEGEVFEVDTPNVSLTLRRPGYYRVDVDQDGNTHASILKGAALAVAGGGEVDLRAGDAIQVDGLDRPQYDLVALPRTDSWDRWVDGRTRDLRESVSARYASSDIEGLDDLDREGRWEQIPEHGWAWSPPVTVGWAPYREGRWGWQDPWGWTWISDERWGWAPYHYGSWITSHDRWFWVPVPRTVAIVRYAPARVVFTGSGPGPNVGWFPIGPRDPFSPWWGSRARVNVNLTNATYANRAHITVVNRETFIGGGEVRRGFVKDAAVLRQVAAAPVLRGPIPILPTTASVRVSAGQGSATVIRPPRIESRVVVTRVAPPQAPPPFQAKLSLIRESGGMPVARVTADKLSTDSRGAKPVVPVRAVPEPGKIVLTPKREGVEVRPIRPVTAPPGRVLSTPEQKPPVQKPPDQKPVALPPVERHEVRPAPEQKPVERPPQELRLNQ